MSPLRLFGHATPIRRCEMGIVAVLTDRELSSVAAPLMHPIKAKKNFRTSGPLPVIAACGENHRNRDKFPRCTRPRLRERSARQS